MGSEGGSFRGRKTLPTTGNLKTKDPSRVTHTGVTYTRARVFRNIQLALSLFLILVGWVDAAADKWDKIREVVREGLTKANNKREKTNSVKLHFVDGMVHEFQELPKKVLVLEGGNWIDYDDADP